MWMKWLHNRQPGFYIDAFMNVRGLAPKMGNESRETLRFSEVGNAAAASAAGRVP